MATNYTYPRVDIRTKALKHTSITPAAEDTTVLFAPICTIKGPSGVVTPIHSLAELINTFGELSYSRNGLMALNIYNWLSNYGTVYIYRLNGNREYRYDISYPNNLVSEANQELLTAKYGGDYYKDLSIVITPISQFHFNLEVKSIENGKSTVLETYKRLRADTVKDALAASEFINYKDKFKTVLFETNLQANESYLRFKEFIYKDNKIVVEKISLNGVRSKDAVEPGNDLGKYNDPQGSTSSCAVEKFWRLTARKVIANKLEVPIDIVMDAGYDLATKQAMANALADTTSGNPIRDDVFLILDRYIIANDRISSTPIELTAGQIEAAPFKGNSNIAVYNQYFTIYDNTFNQGKSIYVGPSYFLSQLIPYNDEIYGVQAACAGLRRGILNNVVSINKNPMPDDKEEYFTKHYNYVEKSSREYAFMSQRVFDNSDPSQYTALSFINNARVLQKMKKDIERIGRQYLFEFNDSVTLGQLSTVLNRYVTEWISNRTLASGVVTVEASPYSDEAVLVTLSIKFNGTIEVITVDITIE